MINVVIIAILGLILVAVITRSYYVNKEGFDDVSNGYYSSLSKDLNAAVNTVSSDVSPVIKDVSSDTNDVDSSLKDKKDSKASSSEVSSKASSSEVSSKASSPQVSSKDATNTTKPMRTDIVPQVTISPDGHDAAILQQKSELLKDIQKVVRNEILVNRNTTPIVCGDECSNQNSTVTDAAAQGQEYENNCYKDKEYRCPKNPDGSCPPVPDMTQYVKKDSIPCWGCSLDY
jgi:hypothetical protein